MSTPFTPESHKDRLKFIEDNLSWLRTWLTAPMECHAPIFFFGPDVQKQFLTMIRTHSPKDGDREELLERHARDVLYECVFSKGIERDVQRRMFGFVDCFDRLPNEGDRFWIGVRKLSCFMDVSGLSTMMCSSECAICPRPEKDIVDLMWKTFYFKGEPNELRNRI